MYLYAYTFKGNLTHPNPFYSNRVKLGETGRDGTVRAGIDIYPAIKSRIKEQDNAAVSESPYIVGYWEIKTGIESNVDDAIRDILISEFGAVETREDKLKTEWVVLPADTIDEKVALIENAISQYEDGELERDLPKEIILRETQNVAYDSVINELEKTDKCIVHAACAFGKTFLELALSETYVPGEREVNLVATSGIELANQLTGQFVSHSIKGLKSRNWKTLLVHSGKSVVPGVESTTDVDKLVYELNQTSRPVQMFVVYDSVRTAAEALHKSGYKVNLKMMDEAHRTAANGSVKNTWAVRLKSKKQVALTASLRNIQG
jgi:predicted helicase